MTSYEYKCKPLTHRYEGDAIESCSMWWNNWSSATQIIDYYSLGWNGMTLEEYRKLKKHLFLD